ncbi:AraC family transcriptional regulator [Burkholderia sp. Bp9143]|uniref:helix-turn-helix domain-containing protein n=1 Tax=Burkholderia sp. Bp9143 TaxID=2184574 RepID=UPI000F590BC0|nr:AraC family transcriptional regulator [Burkholderia sp. Bp9143]RQR22050.1 AraC family transcriptional regulator [Burkholderia sp. Bp9143]
MTNKLQSWVSFENNGFYSSLSAAPEIQLEVMSQGEAWRGVHLEIGTAASWEAVDLMVDGHFVSMNIADKTLEMTVRDDHTGKDVTYDFLPGSFWIHAEGTTFSSRRRSGYAKFSGAIIDGNFMDTILGGHHELVSGFGIIDPVLQSLFNALIADLRNPAPHPDVTESIVRAFVLALGRRHGRKAPELSFRSGLNPSQISKIMSWVEQRLDTRISIADLAAVVGLSTAHFSREFKRATNYSPGDYLMEARLDRACKILARGESVCDTAIQCGFFDQAHLARMFKRRYGLSPSIYGRQARDHKKSPASSGKSLSGTTGSAK